MARINLLLPDQALDLRALISAISSLADARRGCRFLASKVAVILDVSAAVAEKRRGEWFVRAAAGAPPAREVVAEAAARAGAVIESGRAVADVLMDGHPWTAASLVRGDGARILLISGDWTLSASLLESIAAELGATLNRLVKYARRPAGRGMAEAWSLPRRLAFAADETRVQMIMDACAKTVGAETGSLALYDEEQQALSVSATFGYSAALVRYLRVRAGEGIIGSVYRSGRTMLIEDVRQVKGGRSPRLRYRTGSFMCVPLLGANRVLGVISVADRRDRQPFDRIDLRNLRMIAGVASLVLERASALQAAKIKEGEAAVDPLTGLFNRRSFRKRLNEEVERAGRQGSPLSLAMVDVDNFKRLNDQLGHRFGDSALRLVANVLQRSTRLFDTSARVGGDEFAILMPGSGLDTSRHIAQRIRESIEGARPSGQQGPEDANVTVSMGIATLTDTSADEFVDRADRALYMAKRDGKNCVRWWEEPSAPSEGAWTG